MSHPLTRYCQNRGGGNTIGQPKKLNILVRLIGSTENPPTAIPEISVVTQPQNSGVKMNIKTIEITNIKGIGHKSFTLDLVPNRPNILVAPNGFGKSSFAIAFDSLRSNKIELNDKHYFRNDVNNRPALSLTLTTGETVLADDNQNTISDYFDVFVINNQTEPKSIVQSFGGKTFAKTSLDIVPTILIQTIPAKIAFGYNSATMKSHFGTNGSKLLNNISNLFNCGQLFYRIDREIDFTRFALKAYRATFDSLIPEINRQNGTGNTIKS